MARSNIIDRVIGYFSPLAGVRRLAAREVLTKRAYEGASRADGWAPRRAGASANTDHAADAGELRSRARALYQNVPYIKRGINARVENAIGTGISPRSLAKGAMRRRVDELWDQWQSVADADGVSDLYGLWARAYRALRLDGEVLMRLRPRSPDDGLPVPLQVQLLEIDYLDSSKNGAVGGNTVINGIEYNPIGQVTAYWLFNEHPGDIKTVRGLRSSVPVPANRIIHLFKADRPGAKRGVSTLASVIARVRDLQNYEDAELARKNLETRLSVLASGDISQMAAPEAGQGVATGSLGELPSGGVTSVPPGVNLTVIEPKAAPGYEAYVKHQLHLIAAGMEVTYEMLTGDMTGVNFSSARVALIDFRRSVEQEQWLELIPHMTRLWREFIDTAVLAGALPRREYAVDWSTPKWDYVNPLQEVNADNAEIAGGLSSISEKLRRRGYKPDLVFEEIASDFKTLNDSGVLPMLLAMKSGNVAALSPLGDSSRPEQVE
ncbi:MAG: phage portal protein [Burkholderiaceae bacterium]|nr:phage portal protein [Burkholderiaceae bacterium]